MMVRIARAVLAALTCALVCGWASGRTLEFKTTQATDADIAVSPDGKHLVVTILGHLFRVSADGGTAEQLTFGACYDNDPVFSPDGRRVAFVSDRDGSGGNVFVLELQSGQVTQVTRETHAAQPTWAPDGGTIYYLRYLPREENPRPRSLFGGPALCDLRKIALDKDAKPVPLRGPGLLKSIFFLTGEQPVWTVVEQGAGGGGGGFGATRSTTQIETLDPKDGKVTRLRSVPGDIGRVLGSPRRDGVYLRSQDVRFYKLADIPAPRMTGFPGGGGGGATRFAVTSDGKTGYLSARGQLVKVSLDGGQREPLKLTAAVKMEVNDPVRPKWAPAEVGGAVQARGVLNPDLSSDGRSLTFMAGGYLWQQPLDGQAKARRLLKGDAWDCEPALAPDGKRLAFVRSQFGKRELRLLDLESGKDRTLLDLGDSGWARYPSWSSDGKRLVFQKSTALQSPFELIAVTVADGKTERLTTAAGDWSSRPHFSKDGEALYFTSRIEGVGSMYRLSLKDKGRPQSVAQLAKHLNEARVSPDGKWVAFRRNTELWIAPLDSKPIEEKSARRLSPDGGASFTFTPDATAVVYAVGNRVWRHPLGEGEPTELPVRLDLHSPTPPPLLLRRVRALDFALGKFSEETSLLVERGRIAWIGAESGRKLPEGVIVLDAAGKYAIPGLFDFHTHSAWANYEAHPDTFLAYGLTSIRDTGGSLTTLSALADRSDVSGDALPRYFYSGEIFEGAQPTWGDAFLQVYAPEDARNAVKRFKDRGAHFIKAYSSLPWVLHHAVAAEARKQGIPVAGHGLNHEEVVKSVILGYMGLEHCPLSLNEDVKLMLAAAGTRCDPTLAILGGHSGLLRREPKLLDDPKLHTYFTEAHIRASRGGGFAMGGGRLVDLPGAHRAGVKLHAGTDSLMTGTFFGQSLHWELEHLVDTGLKPLEVLRMATEEAATALGADGHLGTLASGKLADILLLDADPLDKIRNTQAIWRVVKGGKVYDPMKLRQAVPDAKAGVENVCVGYLYQRPRVINFGIYTHLCHAFVTADENGKILPTRNCPNKDLVADAHKANVKILLSLGGWGWDKQFAAIVSKREAEDGYVAAVMKIVEEYDYDGIDLDWEYPDTKEEIVGFERLSRRFRKELDELGAKKGRRLIQTMAAAANPTTLKWLTYELLLETMDWVNVMTYDFAGDWTDFAGHHSPLFVSRKQPGTPHSTELSMKYLVDRGMPANRLAVGLPLYGKGFAVSEPYASTKNASKGGRVPRGGNYTRIERLIEERGWKRQWDDETKNPWAIAADGSAVIGYDDAESLSRKTEWAVQQGFRGVFFWEIGGDLLPDGTNPLQRAVRNILDKSKRDTGRK